MNKEIERKYAIRYLPKDIEIQAVKDIEQAFIYQDNTIIRIRNIKTHERNSNGKQMDYIYTVKTKGDMQYDKHSTEAKAYEIENNISKEEYGKLLTKKISNQITKTRMVVPIQNNLKVEIDIYGEYLQGFLTAEVEFPSEEAANQFEKPDWLGEEIGYQELSNRKLAEMDRNQFESKVSKEMIQHNKMIIEELEQLIKKCY